MELKIYNNNKKSNFSVLRDEYTVVDIYYKDFTNEMKQNLNFEVNSIFKNTNATSANTGNKRTLHQQYVNAFSGVISEMATVKMLNTLFPKFEAKREESNNYNPQNHTDIEFNTKYNKFNIEVRSSFVNNGIEFALFNKNINGDQYFNVIGPYKNNSHKIKFEKYSDIYIRVLIDNRQKINQNAKLFRKKFINNLIPVTIVGGLPKEIFMEKGFIKKYNTDLIGTQFNGKYISLELQDIYDIRIIKKYIEHLENDYPSN